MSQNTVALIITIIAGCLTVSGTLLGVAWKLRGDLAKIEIEMASFREVMLATNRRIERLEGKIF